MIDLFTGLLTTDTLESQRINFLSLQFTSNYCHILTFLAWLKITLLK